MIDQIPRPTPEDVQIAVASLDAEAGSLWCEMLAAGLDAGSLRWADSDEHDRRLKALPPDQQRPPVFRAVPCRGRTFSPGSHNSGAVWPSKGLREGR